MNLVHHAYYIEGSQSSFESYKGLLQPFWAKSFERFGIDEARELIALASLKNFADATFLIAAASITSEAQQALLKLFEEPQAGTTFVLLVPHGSLLPTLKSRMLVYPGDVMPDKKSSGLLSRPGRPAGQTILPDTTITRQADDFLSASNKDRSDMITKLLKDDEGVKERVRDFINALETKLVRLNLTNKEVRQGLEDIAIVRDYLADRSPSLKMLLEHLALSLPSF